MLPEIAVRGIGIPTPLATGKPGVGVSVGVEVGVGVSVRVGVEVGVEVDVGVNVLVCVGVNVGPNSFPGLQEARNKQHEMANKRNRFISITPP